MRNIASRSSASVICAVSSVPVNVNAEVEFVDDALMTDLALRSLSRMASYGLRDQTVSRWP